ncbi:uncharacterized protein M437DRAFT_46137 [Aureobasidium melanogenum CBS 110374]|uniref:N-acetyltransferase domain-containing protein n=1 Tax=Aureobasidium melanogenum (strain CBS 110374) TaxID=1043003 RepID=A0A074W1J5_AURM1|nr:uncharacterized protein M437DRAFT_46137 [Aureobasidium melanogenum CBS 110374]KEQ63797.1 hypothetical protein M437DRAFT_46137 [Aureobasidium melanogenum CBS 110374]
MDYEIQPVDYTDAPGLAETMMLAMSQSPHYTLLLSNTPIQDLIHDTCLRMPQNITSNRDFLRHQKVIHIPTGRIVAYTRWELPELETSKDVWLDAQMVAPTLVQQKAFKESFDLTQLNGKRKIFNYEMGDFVGPKLGKVYNELVQSGGPYLVLDYMVCHPEHQRQGIASLLLKNGEIEAKKLGLKIFVMTSTDPGSTDFYEKCGFRNLRTVSLDVGKWGEETPHVTSFLEKEVVKVEGV